MVLDRHCLEDSEQKDHSITQSINDHEGVYRTASATPGLLMTHTMFNKAVCEAAIIASLGLINQVNIDSRLLKDFCITV